MALPTVAGRSPCALPPPEILAPAHRVNFRRLLRLLHMERGPNGTLAFRAVPDPFPRRICLRLLKIRKFLDSAGRCFAPVSLDRVRARTPSVLLIRLLFVRRMLHRQSRHLLIISTADQQMLVLHDNVKIVSYPVSTSRFGVGDAPSSNATPLGLLKVRKKIGAHAPAGAVFKSGVPRERSFRRTHPDVTRSSAASFGSKDSNRATETPSTATSTSMARLKSAISEWPPAMDASACALAT